MGLEEITTVHRADIADAATMPVSPRLTEPRRAQAVYQALRLTGDIGGVRDLLQFSGRKPYNRPLPLSLNRQDYAALAKTLRAHGCALTDQGISQFKQAHGMSAVVRITADVATQIVRFARGSDVLVGIHSSDLEGLPPIHLRAFKILSVAGKQADLFAALVTALHGRPPIQPLTLTRKDVDALVGFGKHYGCSFSDDDLGVIARHFGTLPGSIDRCLVSQIAKLVQSRGEPAHRYEVVLQEGHQVNQRTALMLASFANEWRRPFRIIKGSVVGTMNKGAHPHAGGGVVDLVVDTLDAAQIDEAVRLLRRMGFAAWYRGARAIPHVHGVAVGDQHLSAAARWQVQAYFRGQDGRVPLKPDPHAHLKVSLPAWVGKYRFS